MGLKSFYKNKSKTNNLIEIKLKQLNLIQI